MVHHQFYPRLLHLVLCHLSQEELANFASGSFSEAEIAGLSLKTMAALNSFTILYNSCSLMISVLTWPLIRRNLVAGQKWSFWLLVGVIGFIETMAFIASSSIWNGRWQVNVLQSVLYLVGISLSGYSIFNGAKNDFK